MNFLDRHALYLSFGCVTRRGFERRCTKLLKGRNEHGEPMHTKVEEFFKSSGFQEYWVNDWRHFWRALGAYGGALDIGHMTRAAALEYFRNSNAGARVLKVDDVHHYIFYSTDQGSK